MPHPPLHDLCVCVSAPAATLSSRSGDVLPDAAQGIYVADRRALSLLQVDVVEHPLVPLRGAATGGADARFVSVVDGAGDAIPDPTVTLERRRTATASGLEEVVEVVSVAQAPVHLTLGITIASDLAPMTIVREGRRAPLVPPIVVEGGVTWSDGAGFDVLVTATGAGAVELDADASTVRMTWEVSLPPRSSSRIELTVAATDSDRGAAFFEAPSRIPWSIPSVAADDVRLPALVEHGLADLAGLLLREDDDHVLAAGAPWFLTLFGRDSLWAARFLLPLGTDLALGTLRVLARRAGTAFDVDSAEEPGRILHEVRRGTLTLGGMALPPVYYGSVDSTPLWVCLLVDAWRWGADPDAVADLIPAAEDALRWMRDHGDADGDGFLEYIDRSGRGLGNQGWKDSFDSVQWADGRLADAPIALSEVQAYAYQAAAGGAALLRAFGRPGADEWDAWAAQVKERFRSSFWTEDARGPYPGIALDRDKRLVDGVASNMGHLLGTGILDPDEAAAVAQRLAQPDLDSGFGLRTLTADSPRFGPLSYHGGSVWPHDTAIAVLGLAAEGQDEVAASFVRGLLSAGAAFDLRLPELFAGVQAGRGARPHPYPPSCRPQAWAAASAVAMLTAVVGLRPDVPSGSVALRPMAPSPAGRIEVRGLRIAGRDVRVEVSSSGGILGTGGLDGLALA